MRKFFFLLFSITILSCSEQISVVEETHSDGSPKLVVIYEINNDQRTKVSETSYYESGSIKMSGEYKNNKRHAAWKAWHENGQLWSSGYYDEGIRQGPAIVHHRNGEIHIKGSFKDDEPEGIWLWYDTLGNLTKELPYGSARK